MEISDLKIGTRLELEILGSSGEKAGNTYVSQTLEPVKNTNLIISAPIYESRLIYVPVGGKVRITFFHSRYGLQGFYATVNSREQRGNLSVICIEAKTQPEKIQRRTYYRLDCALDVEYRIHFSNDRQESDKPPYKKALTKNLSGSGACIVVGEEIMKNTILDIKISLSDILKIKAICSVLRCIALEISSKNSKYELGLHFSVIDDQDQDKIIKYIFEQQRRLLKTM